jgi:hypothetical protein
MKKLLSVLLLSLCVGSVFADDSAANVKIHIASPSHDNRYFLCLSGVGCLSIKVANEGKVFPVFHSIAMDNIYVADAGKGLLVSPQGLPSSCNVTVSANQTIAISGSITPMADGRVKVNNLHCTVS